MRSFKLFYGWQYAAIATFYPFVALYLAAAGFDGVQMGLLFGLTPIISLLALPVWGVVADTLGMRRRLLTAMCFISAALPLLLPAARGFVAVMVVMLVLALFRSPIMPIANAITLEALEPQRERFPQIRLWGSFTYAIVSLLVGWWVIDRHVTWTAYLLAAAMLVTGWASRRLPSSKARITVRWWQAGAVVWGNREFVVSTLALVLLQFTNPIASAYLPLYFKELSAPGWMVGAAASIAAAVEVPLMALTPRLIRRYGARRVLLALTLAVPVRWALYHFITVPALILPFQFLHSASAAGYYAAAITYVDSLCPPRWRATGQSFYSAMSDGLGVGAGSMFFGWVYQVGGLPQAFTLGAVVALAGWLILAVGIGWRSKGAEEPGSRGAGV